MNKVKKYDWLDILRIISCFAVILLHCSCDAFSVTQGIIGFTIGTFIIQYLDFVFLYF